MIARLNERHRRLSCLASENKTNKENLAAYVQNFENTFYSKREELRGLIDEVLAIDERNRVEAARLLNELLGDLQKYLAEWSSYLPSFEVRKAQSSLNELSLNIQSAQESFAPRQKFTFTHHPADKLDSASCLEQTGAEENTSKNSDNEPSKNAQQVAASKEIARVNVLGLSNQQNRTLCLNEECEGRDVLLFSLDSCTVYIKAVASTVHMAKLRNCHLVILPVSTSVLMENCSDCVVSVACQQLRIHQTHDCSFYIHITGKAIIEDSNAIHVAPYNLKCDRMSELFQKAHLNVAVNHWNEVEDFNWLVKDVQSPNWDCIPVGDRIAHVAESEAQTDADSKNNDDAIHYQQT
ncbi:unnamed protein product [Soboliphyme baturini]|uniref:C-CAP/cofactor C-like domain-containing protein n=1 Tax=Soboliphyme baturini TaxID=241478 RepID=A0A183IF99_9BILA|nr:unnamed protein product [Soboliphyme baturini]